jgi:hypothetical protein
MFISTFLNRFVHGRVMTGIVLTSAGGYVDAEAPLLALCGVSKTYRRPRDVTGPTDVSFSIGSGEVVVIFGANGAGKSTLLKILSGAIALDADALSVGGGSGRSSSTSVCVSRTTSSSVRCLCGYALRVQCDTACRTTRARNGQPRSRTGGHSADAGLPGGAGVHSGPRGKGTQLGIESYSLWTC